MASSYKTAHLESRYPYMRQFGCHAVYVNHGLKGTTVAMDQLEAGAGVRLAGIRIAVGAADSP
jgi:hypothetical protein